jgi:LysR family glycine cleavage system transcriptional activator
VTIEPLFEEPIVPMASPDFIREKRLKRPDQLLDMPLIQSNVNVVQWSDWFAAFAHKRAPEKFAIRFDRAHMSIHAAVQGLGVALESAILASNYLKTGELKAVFGSNKAIKVKAHFAVYPPRHAKRRPVEVFLAWLRSEAERSARESVSLKSNS